MSWRIQQSNGIHLPQIDWHLDARKPVKRSFVSHAHFDHMGKHQEILCTPDTAALIQHRLPGERIYRIHEFGEPFELAPGTQASLHPAGHIPGSAMLRLENEHGSLLYTGDFKLSPSSSAETCQPVQADTLIIETTYGVPRYTFPPESEIAADIVRFCKDTLENGDTPVLFGYSLGKSQSILRWLTDSNLTVMLHSKSLELTKTCEELGWKFPAYRPFTDNSHQGHVIISPPQPKNSSWLKRIHNPKTAMISGWAIDPSAIYRYQCDKAFPLSDHSDYLDLQSFVAQVNPKTIYTVHGFAQEFAQTLREQSYEAYALGKENQLDLNISAPPLATKTPKSELDSPPVQSSNSPTSFATLTSLSHQIAATDSHTKKTDFLTTHLSNLNPTDTAHACQLLSGIPIDIDKSLLRQAAQIPTNSTASRNLQYIQTFLQNLATSPSPTFRFSFLNEELRKLPADEANLLIRILKNNLQIGLAPDHIEAAIANRFNLSTDSIQRAHRRCSDLSTVISAAVNNSLQQIKIRPFTPVPFNRAEKTDTQEALFERLENRTWIEDKFNGLRCQIHKVAEHADIYDQNHQRITHQFPELIEAAKLIPQDFIADAEIVAWDYTHPLPLADLQKRLARRGEDLFIGEETQVLLWLFDLLWINENDLLDLPLADRRKHLDTFSVNPKIRISPVTNLQNPLEIESHLTSAHERGNAGIIFKDPTASYELGTKPNAWISFEGTDSK